MPSDQDILKAIEKKKKEEREQLRVTLPDNLELLKIHISIISDIISKMKGSNDPSEMAKLFNQHKSDYISNAKTFISDMKECQSFITRLENDKLRDKFQNDLRQIHLQFKALRNQYNAISNIANVQEKTMQMQKLSNNSTPLIPSSGIENNNDPQLVNNHPIIKSHRKPVVNSHDENDIDNAQEQIRLKLQESVKKQKGKRNIIDDVEASNQQLRSSIIKVAEHGKNVANLFAQTTDNPSLKKDLNQLADIETQIRDNFVSENPLHPITESGRLMAEMQTQEREKMLEEKYNGQHDGITNDYQVEGQPINNVDVILNDAFKAYEQAVSTYEIAKNENEKYLMMARSSIERFSYKPENPAEFEREVAKNIGELLDKITRSKTTRPLSPKYRETQDKLELLIKDGERIIADYSERKGIYTQLKTEYETKHNEILDDEDVLGQQKAIEEDIKNRSSLRR